MRFNGMIDGMSSEGSHRRKGRLRLAVAVEAIDRSKASSPNDEKVMMRVAQSQMGRIPGVTHLTIIHSKTIETL
jgi:hypothetical protein